MPEFQEYKDAMRAGSIKLKSSRAAREKLPSSLRAAPE
jgi:hypothetical protein